MRTSLRFAFLLIALAFVVATAGCIQQEVHVTVNSDGTGTVSMTMMMSKQMAAMASSMGAEEGGEGGGMDMMAQGKKTAASYPAAWDARVEKAEKGDYEGVRITSKFTSPESLVEVITRMMSNSSDAMSEQGQGGGGAFKDFKVVVSGEENEIWTITCVFAGADSNSNPGDPGDDPFSGPDGSGDGMGDGDGDGMGDGDGDGLQSDDESNEAMGEAMGAMMDMKFELAISMPDITEATCTNADGKDMSSIRTISGNTARFTFGTAQLMKAGDSKTFNLKVVGSTKGGLSTMMLIVIGVLGLVVIGTLVAVIRR